MRMVLRELEPSDLTDNTEKVADVVSSYVETLKMLRSDIDSGEVPVGCSDELAAEVKAMNFSDLGVAMAVSEDGMVVLELK